MAESRWRTNSNRLTAKATPLALALAIGIALARLDISFAQSPRLWLLAAAGCLLVAAGCAFAAHARAVKAIGIASISLAMMFLGGARLIVKHEHATPNDLAAWLGDESQLVRVRGIALGAPEMRHRIGGALAKFDYRQPSTYFPMKVTALLSRDGQTTDVHAKVLVRVDEPIMPFRAGDTIEASGFLLRPQEPRNPGEFNYREYARSLGQAGFLTVSSRELLRVTPVERNALTSAWLNWRDQLRRRAAAWLLSDLPEVSRTDRDSLLASLLLGQRDEQIDGVYGSFQRVGLAHVLAISGFHLSVLAGFVLLLSRVITGHRRWHGWIVITFVLLYLMLLEPQMPVLRAGVMTIIASIGLVFARRFHVGGLVSLSAIGLLLWRPDQLFNAGFQLTYGIVLGLIYLSPMLRSRWFGPHNPEAPTTGAMLVQWFYTAVAASVTAWVVAVPLALHHFGLFSPVAVAMSIMTLPLTAIILAFGFLKMMLAAILPSAALLLGFPLSIASNILLDFVYTVDSMGTDFNFAPPPATWAGIATLCACWIIGGDRWLMYVIQNMREWRHKWVSSRAKQPNQNLLAPKHALALRVRHLWIAKWLCAMMLVVWLFWTPRADYALRIDMLSVGDGSCFIIRSDNRTIVFDAGSSTDLNVARRSLIPAMRRLGVRTVEAIIISHADFDHYSAVVELAEAFDVSEVLVTPQFMNEVHADPIGSAAFMLQRLTDMRLVAIAMKAGDVRDFGGMTMTWLHPQGDAMYQRSNDASAVLRIESAGRSVLMCGDIQQNAIKDLLRAIPAAGLRADIMELPHHGSYNDDAVEFVDVVQPSIVMQSTGWQRWRRDRWNEALSQQHRLITARDGACWVQIHASGDITTGRFLADPAAK